ncbi:hypothetical protein [Mycobacteroides chelonae]|uniref:hypothetical protein n=1 Tax=Mycobacteroides chelonae TaxID=1774 RepID=UPI0009BEE75B|nr:hypothetical protein [Mycobacteroides chelonae]
MVENNIEHVFDDLFRDWHDPPDLEILRRVDRRVIVDIHKVWTASYWPPDAPAAGTARPSNSASYEVKQHGLFVNVLQEGRQIAWIRLSTGEYLGLVLVEVSSRAGGSRLTMPLWLQASTFRLPRADGS